MKTTIKIFACLLFLGTVTTVLAQQTGNKSQPASTKKTKKTRKKVNNGMDNKIAVSDQAQPEDKGKKKQAPKKEKGISNK